MTEARVVGLGGGHGLAVTLTALRHYATDITAVVSVADDGGSSGRLRHDFKLPAPGDVRRCLVALADDPEGSWARAFGSRFDRGDVDGHALGNLVLAALADTTGSFCAAIQEAGRLLGAHGRVFPATAEPVVLTAETDGGPLSGQTAVEDQGSGIRAVGLDPAGAAPPPGVLDAIAAAHQIVLGPGSLFTSVLAVTAVTAIRESLEGRPTVFVCNLRPSKETVGFEVADHVEALQRHGVWPAAVLVDPASIELGRLPAHCSVVTADLALPNGWSHDPAKLASALQGIL